MTRRGRLAGRPARVEWAECDRLRVFLEGRAAVGLARAMRKPEVLAGFWPEAAGPSRERALRAIVAAAPAYGVPIASFNGGYYVARAAEDYERCIADLRSRMGELAARANALEALQKGGDAGRLF